MWEIAGWILGIVIIFLNVVEPVPGKITLFEAKRRAGRDNKTSSEILRVLYQAPLKAWYRVIYVISLIAMTAAFVAGYGYFAGIVITIAVTILASPISRFSLVARPLQAIYRGYEAPILSFVNRFQRWILWVEPKKPSQRVKVHSTAELEAIVIASEAVFSTENRRFIKHALAFESQTVAEHMTPRNTIVAVKKAEILGPLVLDDLYKSGYDQFPVIDETIDHIVGILYLRDVLTVDTTRKHTAIAETAMEKQVYFIDQSQTLIDALAEFIRTKQHMLVVVNDTRETVGLLTLTDVTTSLFGRSIESHHQFHKGSRALVKVPSKRSGH